MFLEKLCDIDKIPSGVEIRTDDGKIAEINQVSEVGSTISFACVHPNTYLIGSNKTVCTQNETWTVPFPERCGK